MRLWIKIICIILFIYIYGLLYSASGEPNYSGNHGDWDRSRKTYDLYVEGCREFFKNDYLGCENVNLDLCQGARCSTNAYYYTTFSSADIYARVSEEDKSMGCIQFSRFLKENVNNLSHELRNVNIKPVIPSDNYCMYCTQLDRSDQKYLNYYICPKWIEKTSYMKLRVRYMINNLRDPFDELYWPAEIWVFLKYGYTLGTRF